MSKVETVTPEVVSEGKEVKEAAIVLAKRAMSIEIKDDPGYKAAAEVLKEIRIGRKGLDAHFDPKIERWHQGHKAELADKKKYDDPLKAGERAIMDAMRKYDDQKEAVRLTEIRKAEEEARRQAQERQLQEAVAAEQEGDHHAAEAILNEKPSVGVIAPPPAATVKTDGVSGRKNWKFEIVNEGLLPREYMMPDEKKIRRVVEAMEDSTQIPGIRVYSERGYAVRV